MRVEKDQPEKLFKYTVNGIAFPTLSGFSVYLYDIGKGEMDKVGFQI